jgi:hypothetical protein
LAATARALATSATSAAERPSPAASAADNTPKPIAMPRDRESTTSTGIGDCSAAKRADWHVPDISDEMWTDTTAVAPAAAAASYASTNSCGDGRDVLSGVKDCNASERDSIVTSTPSRCCLPPTTT